MSGRILIVDDEPDWVELVEFWLRKAHFADIENAPTGTLALEAMRRRAPDCVLLDLVLPDQSGLEVCRTIRSIPELMRLPVVLLTNHKRERMLGLQNGADYFVSKSENPEELLATLDAVFRRRQTEEGLLVRGELTLRSSDRRVLWQGREAGALTPKTFLLLHVLVKRSPQPVGRDELYRLVEGADNPGLSRALDVMLNRLRKALPPEVAGRIVSVKNFGWVFLDKPAVTAM